MFPKQVVQRAWLWAQEGPPEKLPRTLEPAHPALHPCGPPDPALPSLPLCLSHTLSLSLTHTHTESGRADVDNVSLKSQDSLNHHTSVQFCISDTRKDPGCHLSPLTQEG